jgi:hypothetical protein
MPLLLEAEAALSDQVETVQRPQLVGRRGLQVQQEILEPVLLLMRS